MFNEDNFNDFLYNMYERGQKAALDNPELIPSSSITLADLMTDEFIPYLKKSSKQFVFTLDNNDGETILEEYSHEYYLDNLASFCRSFLRNYERVVEND